MKPCPHCGEAIQEGAVKCKYCREFIDPPPVVNAPIGSQPAPTQDRKQKSVTALRTSDKDHETHVLEPDGLRIEVIRRLSKPQRLELFIDGQSYGVAGAPGQKVRAQVPGQTSLHTVEVWFEAATGAATQFLALLHGTGILIDGRPVHGTLADPYVHVKEGRAGVWVFAVFLFAKVLLSPWINPGGDVAVALVLYGVPGSILVWLATTYRSNPKRAVIIGLVIGVLETLDFAWGALGKIAAGQPSLTGAGIVIWGIFRVGALITLWRARRMLARL